MRTFYYLTSRGRLVLSSVQSLSRVRLFATQWIAARQASLSITNSQSSQVHWVSDAIQPSHPRSSPSPPDPNPSQHQSLLVKTLEIQREKTNYLQRNDSETNSFHWIWWEWTFFVFWLFTFFSPEMSAQDLSLNSILL